MIKYANGRTADGVGDTHVRVPLEPHMGDGQPEGAERLEWPDAEEEVKAEAAMDVEEQEGNDQAEQQEEQEGDGQVEDIETIENVGESETLDEE